jgi:hypothetical protein
MVTAESPAMYGSTPSAVATGDDDGGSMVRATTTVVTPAGRRNIGTSIARTDPDGTPNPVLAGQTYTGAATVADRPYFATYAGVRSAMSKLIGMLYVGLLLDSTAS